MLLQSKYHGVLGQIGNTPLVDTSIGSAGKVMAKLEFLNPSGSMKDRAAISMVEAAEKRGDLKKGGTIVEASSGCQGIALAMIGAVKGYKVIITLKKKVSKDKQDILKAYGAEVVVCSGSDDFNDPDNYHTKAVEITKSTPGAFMPNQHFNFDNAQGYYKTLGPEIWSQTDGQITHFITAAGTGGTINGTSRFLKEKNPNINVIAVDAANSWRSTNGSPKSYGIEGMGVDYDNEWLKGNIIDEYITVTDDQAISTVKKLARKDGFFVGGSSGAIAYAAMRASHRMNKDDLAVIVFPDSGRYYLSKGWF